MSAQQLWPEVMMNNYGTPPLEIKEGTGSHLIDVEGKSYIDLLSGIAVNSLGYGHPGVVEAVSAQVSKFAHLSNTFVHSGVVEVAQKLVERTGSPDNARVFFSNSGAEANEAAFKLARLTGKSRILAAAHGFHGRTMGSLALTGQPDKRKPFDPVAAGVEFYPYGDIDFLTKTVETNPNDVAAIFLEPIQGEPGVITPPEGFLKQVRELCDKYGILMVVDEVQTGVGRTGRFFAYEHSGITPDVITMAKGLAAGLPVGATIAIGKAAEFFGPGSHGSTFGGNPVSMAAAQVVLDTVDETFMANVSEKGSRLAELVGSIDGVSTVRGKGLLLGAVLEGDVAKQVVTEGYNQGFIVNAPAENVLRLAPPLVITEDEIDDAAARLNRALKKVLDK